MGKHGIAVEFMGNWDDLAAYRYITEKLLDEEMDDIRIEGMVTHFEATTPEYDVEMWVDIFVMDLFWQKNEYFLSGLKKQPLFNSQGESISHDLFVQKIKKVWEHLSPDMHASVEPIATQVNGEEATVTAVITWPHHQRQKQVNSSFRLQISAFYGWDIVQTSLLDDLLATLR